MKLRIIGALIIIAIAGQLPAQTTITKSVSQGTGGSSEWVINQTKVGGTAIDTNSGTKSPGTQRVVIANDQPALTNAQPVKEAAGDNVALGNPTDTGVGDATGTLNAHTRQIVANQTNNTQTTKLTNGTTPADTYSGDTGQNGVLIAGSRKEVAFSTTTAQAVAGTDVSNYRWVSVQITAQGGSSTVTFQGSNDNSSWQSLALLQSSATGNTQSVTNQTGNGIWTGPVPTRYFRLNVTGIVSGTTSGVVEFFATPVSLFGNLINVNESGTWTMQPGNTANTTPWLFQIRDAAGNARGANVNASNEMNVSPGATENYLGFVGGKVITASANFTRPADTTPYASGDIVANSTTAGSVTPMSFTVARLNDSTGMIRRARLKKSGTSTNASFRLHLYQNDPSASTGIANGDNGVWSTKEAGYLGSIDITVDKAFSDAAEGVGTPNNGTEINFIPKSGTQLIYGLLEARGAYTPGNAEVFTVYLEDLQN